MVYELYVPVIPNGNNKILYFVLFNYDYDYLNHGDVLINDNVAERLRNGWQNAFSNYFNSKKITRYIATFVPASWINSTDNFIRVKINF